MTPRARRRGPGLRGASTSILLACAFGCGAACAQVAAAPPAGNGEALRDAIAGPLVAALSEQFGGRDVDMQLDRIATMPLGDGASMVSGNGIVQADGNTARPAAFSFRLPWNSSLQQAGYPEVSVAGAVGGERNVPNDVILVRKLEADVTTALVHRLHQPATSVRLDRIATVEDGSRFLRISAQGMAYTGRSDGGTPLTILALYDRTRRAWSRLDYGLGEAASGWASR
jgi:hypothetical protein